MTSEEFPRVVHTMLRLVGDQLAVSELMLTALASAGAPATLLVGAAARLDQLRTAVRQAQELLIAAELAGAPPVRIVAVGGLTRPRARRAGQARRRPRR